MATKTRRLELKSPAEAASPARPQRQQHRNHRPERSQNPQRVDHTMRAHPPALFARRLHQRQSFDKQHRKDTWHQVQNDLRPETPVAANSAVSVQNHGGGLLLPPLAMLPCGNSTSKGAAHPGNTTRPCSVVERGLQDSHPSSTQSGCPSSAASPAAWRGYRNLALVVGEELRRSLRLARQDSIIAKTASGSAQTTPFASGWQWLRQSLCCQL